MQLATGTLAPPRPASIVAARAWTISIRRSEWIVLAFLFYAEVLAHLLPVAPEVEFRISLWNSVVALACAILVYVDSVRPTLAASIARDWLPLAIVLLAYREMGWFAQPHIGSELESRFVVWDRLLLRHGGKAAIEALGSILPSLLEIAYSLVYTLAPLAVAVLCLAGYRARVDRFLFVFVLGVLLCYAQCPFWPSEPPRVVFFGEDAPAFDTVFRRFNLWMLGNYGIHTSVFPSAHVAGAFAAAFGLRQTAPELKWVSRFLFVIATLIALATVYGRYHYVCDAAAGFIVARERIRNPQRFAGSCQPNPSSSS